MSLFVAMVDDIEQELARAGIRGVQFSLPRAGQEQKETKQTRNLDFADDLVLLLEHEEEVEKALKIVESFYLKRKLIPNPQKCEFIVFDPKKRSVKTKPKILNRELKQVKEVLYLGQTITQCATWSRHIKKRTKRAAAWRHKAYSVARKHGKAPIGTEITIF